MLSVVEPNGARLAPRVDHGDGEWAGARVFAWAATPVVKRGGEGVSHRQLELHREARQQATVAFDRQIRMRFSRLRRRRSHVGGVGAWNEQRKNHAGGDQV